MKIEVLYPEICTLFGDKANMRYFEACLPEAEFIKTPVSEAPHFIAEDVDMVYIGSVSETNQEKILSRLKGNEERIRELIAKGVIFLCTGNAFEIFGKEIETEKGEKIPALGIFPYRAVRTIPTRNNSLFLGKYGETEIVGYTSRFSNAFDIPESKALFTVTKGYGSTPDAKTEGYKEENFFGTYLLGPFLIQNPLFVKELMRLLGVSEPKLAFGDDINKAYEVRLNEFKTDIVFAE